jgi:alkylation response protein AidB-like acyl-CoA dehydrogenase
MSVGAARSSATTPDVCDLLTRARAIAALARERAQQTEADRRVGDDMIERMRQADLFRIMQPRSYGGLEYGFDVFAQVVAAIAGGCGSTGWVYGLLASHQWLIACFSKAAQDEVWQDRTALAAGTYAPVGQAVAVDGGYRLSGVGSFCSGCDNAQWQLLGGMIPQPDAAATPGFFLLRSADCVIDDNWHTMGLAGTGSKNIVARDVFVPAHRTLAFAELTEATAPGMRANPNPLYRQSFLAVLPITIVSPVLGMAEGALADFLAMAGVRTTRGAVAGGNRRMAELTTVQMRVAEASACIDAARLLMFRDLAEAFETAARGEPIGVDVRLRNRRDQAFCVRLLVGAIDALFLAAGGQGLFLEQPLQRAWRDAHAAASHISLNWDSTGSMYGQFMLGLEPKGQY